MTVLENMQAVLPSLPKNERKAAEYLLNYPHDIQRRSAEVIAQDAGISRSAIVFISSDSSPNFLRNLLISFHSAACPEAVLPPDSSVPVSHLSFPYRCLRRLQKE